MLCVGFEPATTLFQDVTAYALDWATTIMPHLSVNRTATANYQYTQPLFYARFLYAFVLHVPCQFTLLNLHSHTFGLNALSLAGFCYAHERYPLSDSEYNFIYAHFFRTQLQSE
jgi:hypothetical protein